MKITITSSGGFEPEVYESLEELAEELSAGAEDEYAESVISRVKAGETHFSIPNGLVSTDTYDITEENGS